MTTKVVLKKSFIFLNYVMKVNINVDKRLHFNISRYISVTGNKENTNLAH